MSVNKSTLSCFLLLQIAVLGELAVAIQIFIQYFTQLPAYTRWAAEYDSFHKGNESINAAAATTVAYGTS